MKEGFRVGDIVKVKGLDGPTMVVVGIGRIEREREAYLREELRTRGEGQYVPNVMNNEQISCTWFDSRGRLQGSYLEAYLLEKQG